MGDIILNQEEFKRGWSSGLPETPCGFGSKLSETKKQREWIPGILKKYRIKSIADIGAGDLNWIRRMDMGNVTYLPFDLVPRHPSVTQFDLVKQVPPKVDMIMCLWVLNHLPADDCLKAIANIKASGAKYLMMTDRPKWHSEQPDELKEMEAITQIVIRPTSGDLIKFIKL